MRKSPSLRNFDVLEFFHGVFVNKTFPLAPLVGRLDLQQDIVSTLGVGEPDYPPPPCVRPLHSFSSCFLGNSLELFHSCKFDQIHIQSLG